MSRYKTSLVILFIALILVVTLPVLAAAKRGRPMGQYRYTVISTNTYRGYSESGRDRGKLKVSGRRIVGKNQTNTSSFVLKPDKRLTPDRNQTGRARGNWTITDSRFGLNRGKLTANIRIQMTRVGTWKLKGNYTGRITKGRARGAVQTGRITAKSI